MHYAYMAMKAHPYNRHRAFALFNCNIDEALDILRCSTRHTDRMLTVDCTGECTTRDIYTSSLNQLKRHIFIFPSRYACAAHSGWFNLAMLQATSAIISDPLNPECRFWFGVCTRALYALALSYPLLAQVLRVFVGMAVAKGIVSPWEADTILQRLSNPPRKEDLRADYILDLDLALHNRRSARMDALASSLESEISTRTG